METVTHNIPPLFDKNSRVLLLGSMPSPKSRETRFFYGHPQNRFWRVLAAVFRTPLPHVALWDTIAQCDIKGASDSSIKNVIPNDINSLLKQTNITRIFATGGKSAALYRKWIEPQTHMPIIQLPSTSPANAAWSLERLIEAYRIVAEE